MQYLLSMYQPDGGTPEPEQLKKIMADLGAINAELQSIGAWVGAGGLHPASEAVVVRSPQGETVVTDGPFVEATEHMGGYTMIDVPDPATAQYWAGRISEVTWGLPIEIRALR